MTTVRPSARSLVLPVVAGAMALAVGACSSAGTPTWSYPPDQPPIAAAPAPILAAPPAADSVSTSTGSGGVGGAMAMPGMAQAAAPAAVAQSEPAAAPFALNLTIVTGDMIGHTEFPAFVPADITLPANSTVVVTITNFDDATPLPKGAEQYAKVSGTVDGTATVTPIRAAYPNGASASARQISALNPADVSHTLTVPGLGVNVPIPASSRETFTIHTGAPGVYTWHCMDPCGDGTTGWGTAMAMKKGFMEGTITVVA